MKTRRRMLPEGWYPGSDGAIRAMLDGWTAEAGPVRPGAVAAVAPHAGWFFSGRLAWMAWLSAGQPDACVVLGGHLPAGRAFRYCPEDRFETPSGAVAALPELVSSLVATFGAVPDYDADNTVEVHLPMLARRFPGVPCACFRVPADARAISFGQALAAYSKTTGKRIFVLGSTDLTHYGAGYGFEPDGPGAPGFAWARRADVRFVDQVLAGDAPGALEAAERDRSACSAGAAVAAMAYASAIAGKQASLTPGAQADNVDQAARAAQAVLGCARDAESGVDAILLGRDSSDRMMPGADSSVGYCAVGLYAPGLE